MGFAQTRLVLSPHRLPLGAPDLYAGLTAKALDLLRPGFAAKGTGPFTPRLGRKGTGLSRPGLTAKALAFHALAWH